VGSAVTLPSAELRRGRVRLRAVVDDDLPAFVDALRDPLVTDGAYHGQVVATEESAGRAFERFRERAEAGSGVLLSVWEDGEDRLSGQTMLFDVDWDERTAELGFWTAPWSRRKGLSGPALGLTFDLALAHLGLERIFGLTNVDNLAAQRAMAAAGMQREGVLRGYERTATGRLDLVCYGVLVGDPRP
jgi:RimJ/RimL family protein N-acetyltransferase